MTSLLIRPEQPGSGVEAAAERLRFPAVWIVWLLAAAGATGGLFLWQVEYFRSPGPQFYRMLLAALPCFLLVLAAYLRLRRTALWRWEPAFIGAVFLAALLFYQAAATLVTAWMFVACYATGRWLLEWLGLEPGSAAGEIAMSAAIGFGALSAVLFPLGLAHGYYPWVFALLLGLPCVLFRRHAAGLWRGLKALEHSWRADEGLRDPLAGVAVVFGAIALGSAAMVTLAPSLAFDVLKMHLPAVMFYVSGHALQPVPGLDYSYFPQSAETLMAVAYALAGQPAAQMLPPLFFGLTALLGLALARNAGADRLAAFAGLVAAITAPFVHWAGSVAKNDLLLAFFELSSLYCWLRWRASGQFRWIQVSVFLLAAAFGVKHVALYGAIPLGVLYLYAVWKQRRRVRAALSLAAIFLAFGVVWQVRAYLLTGNPVYPESLTRTAITDKTDKLYPPGTPAAPEGKLARWFLVVWRMHSSAQKIFESPLRSPMGIFLLVCAPAWFLLRRKIPSPAERACLVFVGLFLVYWAATWIVLRYAVPAMFLLYLLTGARLAGFYRAASAPVRASVLGAVVYCFLFAALGAAILEINAPQLRFFARAIDSRGYLREALATYPALEYVGSAAASGDRVLGINNCSSAYAPRHVRFSCLFPPRPEKLRAAAAMQVLAEEYRWIVVPSDSSPEVLDAIRGGRRMAECYRDSAFTVFRVGS